ncbi:hypothetical protein [Niameybacter massiliensis]|uniref:hypothetical protein n=1 Tax=Niameybacter massiliensis TaxID=1658108 RepID=UPI0006B486F1|nr:hypothetical protein [Niameybacter massiliensis]
MNNEDKGYIEVTNRGDFVAYFTVSYVIEGKQYQFVSDSIWEYQHQGVYIPANAQAILLQIYIATFIKLWYPVYHQIFNKPIVSCYEVAGLLVAPYVIPRTCQYQNISNDGGGSLPTTSQEGGNNYNCCYLCNPCCRCCRMGK